MISRIISIDESFDNSEITDHDDSNEKNHEQFKKFNVIEGKVITFDNFSKKRRSSFKKGLLQMDY